MIWKSEVNRHIFKIKHLCGVWGIVSLKYTFKADHRTFQNRVKQNLCISIKLGFKNTDLVKDNTTLITQTHSQFFKSSLKLDFYTKPRFKLFGMSPLVTLLYQIWFLYKLRYHKLKKISLSIVIR